MQNHCFLHKLLLQNLLDNPTFHSSKRSGEHGIVGKSVEKDICVATNAMRR